MEQSNLLLLCPNLQPLRNLLQTDNKMIEIKEFCVSTKGLVGSASVEVKDNF